MVHSLFSRFYLFFLSPANWVILLVVAAYFCRTYTARKRVLIAATIITVVFGNEIIYNHVMMAWQPKPVTLESGKYDAAIILGGMGWVEEKEAGYFRKAADRFIQCTKLYHTGRIQRILISAGGTADSPVEATFLKQQFISQGIREAALLIDDKSTTTFENALFSKRIIDSAGLTPPFILVTSAIHLYRAQKTFEKQGIRVVGYPSDYDVVNVNQFFTDYFWPDVDVLDKWKYLLKEWVGIIGYKAQGKM
jgi:uncharacterized SAM-binding protein YcdF (DUF218 family)